MIQYILKRILLFIPTLFAITVISFGIIQLAPGDPAELKVGIGSDGAMSSKGALNEKTIELIRKQWHLDKPLHEQYFIWVGNLLKFDFGKSFQDNRPVSEKIVERVPITLAMGLISIAIAYMVAVPLGIYSATNQGTTGDKVATVIVFGLYSLPVFWVGTMAISFLCNPEYISLFPTGGIRSINHEDTWSLWRKMTDYAYHLVLPIIVYTYVDFAFISRQMRSGMLEVIRQDYIRTARAKGLSNRTVILKHALRNSLIPIITLLAGILPALIGGSIVVETIFSVPGMGQLALQAMIARDYPTIMAVFTMSAFLTVFGILIADILYSIADPRIAYSAKSS